MEYIDTHAHLYDEAFGDEADFVIEKAMSAGVSVILQPDIDRRERPKMFDLGDRHPGVLFQMIGLHPENVEEGWEADLEDMLRYKGKGIVGIGEIGLDYHYASATASLQKAALERQLRLADELNLPVSIHLRDAWDDFFRVLASCKDVKARGVMHSFSGTAEQWSRLQDFGDWYAGVGGLLTFKHSPIPDIIQGIPMERILLETDAPYMTPAPHRGERNDSSFIPLIATKLSEIKEVSLEEVASVTTANAKKLFQLP